MEELKIGDKVLHNGVEKIIVEIHGDVLILNDKCVVNNEQVSLIEVESISVASEAATPEDEHLAQMQDGERRALRRNIEELNEESAAVAVFAMMQEIDQNIRIADLQEMTVEAMKKRLLHQAVATGRIDPKKCGECGQIVPE